MREVLTANECPLGVGISGGRFYADDEVFSAVRSATWTWCGRVLPECELVVKPLFLAPSRFADDSGLQTVMVTGNEPWSGGDGSCRMSLRI